MPDGPNKFKPIGSCLYGSRSDPISVEFPLVGVFREKSDLQFQSCLAGPRLLIRLAALQFSGYKEKHLKNQQAHLNT